MLLIEGRLVLARLCPHIEVGKFVTQAEELAHPGALDILARLVDRILECPQDRTFDVQCDVGDPADDADHCIAQQLGDTFEHRLEHARNDDSDILGCGGDDQLERIPFEGALEQLPHCGQRQLEGRGQVLHHRPRVVDEACQVGLDAAEGYIEVAQPRAEVVIDDAAHLLADVAPGVLHVRQMLGGIPIGHHRRVLTELVDHLVDRSSVCELILGEAIQLDAKFPQLPCSPGVRIQQVHHRTVEVLAGDVGQVHCRLGDAFDLVGALAQRRQLGDHRFDIALAREGLAAEALDHGGDLFVRGAVPQGECELLVGSFGCGELGECCRYCIAQSLHRGDDRGGGEGALEHSTQFGSSTLEASEIGCG
ncbi:hypothetical protein SDC9_118076 [bioreactor metagenome]|uniref:Uncharacterized protein n=1 Tax=bioreactor metagenome TaxID=1076179 RepID=A0A645C713_9ZZZZ